MFEPHRLAFLPHVARGYTDQQNSQPVNILRPTAAAMDLARVARWLAAEPRARPRRSPLRAATSGLSRLTEEFATSIKSEHEPMI
jgi:hypothetical protein